MRPARASRALAVPAPGPVIDVAGDLVDVTPVQLGRSETGEPIGLDLDDLLDGRLLIQGMSGAGKSWLLRHLLETTAERLQQVVLDPEGEFGSLAERYGHVALDADRLDPEALRHAVTRAREHEVSLWVDLSQAGPDRQLEAVAAILSALMRAPEQHWRPCLVVVDEVHLFAPQGGGQGASAQLRRDAADALADLMRRGRKRGLCGVLATQRLVALARSIAAEAGNVMIGRNTLELDIGRAAKAIGSSDRRARERLRNLAAGVFVAAGPAFNRSPTVVEIGPVLTRHRGSTPRLGPPPERREDALALLDLDELRAASDVRAAARHTGVDPRDVTAVHRFLRELGAVAAVRILRELRQAAPLPKLLAHFGPVLDMTVAEVEAGLALLERYGFARLVMVASGRAAQATAR